MKKLVSLFLALALVFSLTISASAAPVVFDSSTIGRAPDGSSAWSTGNAVEVKVTTGEQGGTRYYVTITWNPMQFTYKRAAEGTWDVVNHEYNNSNVAGWLVDGNPVPQATTTATFTVENHSNAEVAVVATMNSTALKESSNWGVNMSLSNDDRTLASADTVGFRNQTTGDKIEYTLTVGGTPSTDENWGSGFVSLDSVIVTISTPTPTP